MVKVAFSPVKPGLVDYAAQVLSDGFFEGWFVRSTVENMLLAVYEPYDDMDEDGNVTKHYDSLFVGGIERFESNAAAYALNGKI